MRSFVSLAPRRVMPWVLLALLAGCQSVTGGLMSLRGGYADIPVDALREVAGEIEQAVAEGNQEASIADRSGIVVGTEPIKQAIRMRAARRELLDAFLDSGFAWERRNGQVWVIRSRDYKKAGTSRDRDRDALMVSSECANRWTIYEGILKASNFSPKELPAVQRIFFEERIKNMKPGQKYEDESGNEAIVGP